MSSSSLYDLVQHSLRATTIPGTEGEDDDQPTEGLRPFARHGGNAEALWCLGELQLVLAAGEQTGQAFSVVEHAASRGHCPPWHRQPGDDEMFYVLEGEITFWAEDAHTPVRRGQAGTLMFIPRGTPHSFRVETDNARWVTLHTPAGHERFYRFSGGPAGHRRIPSPSEPDMAAVAAAAQAYGVELLGPPPQPPA